MTTPVAAAATRPAPTHAAMRGIGSALFSVMRHMAAARARARTIRVLRTLDDASLRDIGLTRDQIDAVEYNPRYGRHFTRM